MKRTVFCWIGSLFCILPVTTIVATEEASAPRDEVVVAQPLELEVEPSTTAANRTLGQRVFGFESSDDAAADVEPESDLAAESSKSQIRIIRVEAPHSQRTVPAKDSTANTAEVVIPAGEPQLGERRVESPDAQPANRESAVGPLELSPELIDLRTRLRMCLSHYYNRPETTAARSPWAVMHAFIGFGVDTQLIAGERPVNAIAWTCWNGPCYGMRLFYADGGYVVPRIGPGYQGHPGQFLAMMAQCKVKADYEMKVDGHDFTIRDLIEYEMVTCKPNTELTFKLIGLSHYLDTNARWKDQHGSDWDMERLIAEELRQPVIGGTCGGTHRMMGFHYAVKKRTDRGEPVDGQWQRARKYVQDYHAYTFKLQNNDGSFSTSWFEGRADSGGIERRLQTTGHILEWLVASLPEEQLTDPRVVHAVNYLTNLMLENRGQDWEIGPKGHAIHALCIYDERLFGGQPGQRAMQLADHGSRHR